MALKVYKERKRGLCFDFEEVMEGVRGMLEACLEGCKDVREFRRKVEENLECSMEKKGSKTGGTGDAIV